MTSGVGRGDGEDFTPTASSAGTTGGPPAPPGLAPGGPADLIGPSSPPPFATEPLPAPLSPLPPPRPSLGSAPGASRPPWAAAPAPSPPRLPHAGPLVTLPQLAAALQTVTVELDHLRATVEQQASHLQRQDKAMMDQAAEIVRFRQQFQRDMFFANQQNSGIWHSLHHLGRSFDAHRAELLAVRQSSERALADGVNDVKRELRDEIERVSRSTFEGISKLLEQRTGWWTLAKALALPTVIGVGQLVLLWLKK